MEVGFFDFVVFDESSQLRIEDTFPALLRGKIRVVSGDSQQLPPSNYFGEVTDINNIKGEDFNLSSLLITVKMGLFRITIWMYIIAPHPALIQFSNHAFYKKRLIPYLNKNISTIDWIPVNGMFLNRTNLKEAGEIINYLSNEALIKVLG